MNKVIAEWRPNPDVPDEYSHDFFVADVGIDGEACTLKLTDHVAPSGRRYISVSVHAPYQGRGRSLHLDVNGVALNLGWNGGNEPPLSPTPTHADYRRENLTLEQSARLRGA